jgi:hypothetical protein
MRKTLLIAASLACLALPATSQAKPLPSNPAVDQYTEGVPSATGQRSSTGAGAGASGGALPPGTAQSLNAAGKDGAAAAAVAAATAPTPAGTGDDGDSQTSGLGIWLWLILAASLLATVAVYVGRRRTSTPAG